MKKTETTTEKRNRVSTSMFEFLEQETYTTEGMCKSYLVVKPEKFTNNTHYFETLEELAEFHRLLGAYIESKKELEIKN